MVKKCFFLLDSLSVGGSERKTVRAANLLVDRGRDVHLGFLNATTDLRQAIDPRIHVFSGNRKGKFDVRLLMEIRRYINEHNIDTAWAVNLYPVIYLFLATRCTRRKVRVIGSSNITIFRNAYENRKMRLYAPIIRKLDGFVFGSHQQKTAWEKKYKLFGRNLSVIHNGVDTSLFSTGVSDVDRVTSRNLYGFDETDIVIGMVAQFRVEKAHSDLLAACRMLCQQGAPIKLLLVGGGDEKESIRNLAEEWNIADKVVFAGQLDDVRPALVAMDIFALTSRSVETFSNAALEAMSMCLPAILSNIGGAEEMVEHGVNGYVYPPADIDELTACIKKLIDKAVLKELSFAARKRVVEKFSSNIMADQSESIIYGN